MFESRRLFAVLPAMLLLSTCLCLLPACTDGTDPAAGESAGEAGEDTIVIDGKHYAAVEFDLDALPDQPLVLMRTTRGDILFELDNVKAPISTQNFLRYVRSGHYEGTIFHRVEADFMIQGGGYTEGLYRNPHAAPRTARSPIRNEADNGLKNVKGTIAMGLKPGTRNSATCQFFINVKDNRGLDHRGEEHFGYAVFGRIAGGMDTVESIRTAPIKALGDFDSLPMSPIKIVSALVVVPRDDEQGKLDQDSE
jgi:peptidyl-prolyl cis-trans isomerase A (cyclophilin A)